MGVGYDRKSPRRIKGRRDPFEGTTRNYARMKSRAHPVLAGSKKQADKARSKVRRATGTVTPAKKAAASAAPGPTSISAARKKGLSYFYRKEKGVWKKKATVTAEELKASGHKTLKAYLDAKGKKATTKKRNGTTTTTKSKRSQNKRKASGEITPRPGESASAFLRRANKSTTKGMGQHKKITDKTLRMSREAAKQPKIDYAKVTAEERRKRRLKAAGKAYLTTATGAGAGALRWGDVGAGQKFVEGSRKARAALEARTAARLEKARAEAARLRKIKKAKDAAKLGREKGTQTRVMQGLARKKANKTATKAELKKLEAMKNKAAAEGRQATTAARKARETAARIKRAKATPKHRTVSGRRAARKAEKTVKKTPKKTTPLELWKKSNARKLLRRKLLRRKLLRRPLSEKKSS